MGSPCRDAVTTTVPDKAANRVGRIPYFAGFEEPAGRSLAEPAIISVVEGGRDTLKAAPIGSRAQLPVLACRARGQGLGSGCD